VRNSAQIITAILGIIIVLSIVTALLIQIREGMSIIDIFLAREVSLKDLQHANAGYRHSAQMKDLPELAGEMVTKDSINAGHKTRTYYIIIESFRNLDSAREKAAMLKKTINAEFIVLPLSAEGYFRLSYGRYSTYGEAEAVIPEIRRTMGNDAWIYSAEN
jgi:hypothetical protein